MIIAFRPQTADERFQCLYFIVFSAQLGTLALGVCFNFQAFRPQTADERFQCLYFAVFSAQLGICLTFFKAVSDA